jgi:hypothetical protein
MAALRVVQDDSGFAVRWHHPGRLNNSL